MPAFSPRYTNKSGTNPECGSIKIQGRGKVSVYRGKDGGVYYLTRTNNKIYIDSKNNIHKKPKACGPEAKPKNTAPFLPSYEDPSYLLTMSGDLVKPYAPLEQEEP